MNPVHAGLGDLFKTQVDRRTIQIKNALGTGHFLLYTRFESVTLALEGLACGGLRGGCSLGGATEHGGVVDRSLRH